MNQFDAKYSPANVVAMCVASMEIPVSTQRAAGVNHSMATGSRLRPPRSTRVSNREAIRVSYQCWSVSQTQGQHTCAVF